MNKSSEDKAGLLIGGGVLAGAMASVCCIGPLVLTIIGISGAAALAKFEVFRWPMTFTVVAVFIYAGFILYRNQKSCDPDSVCADPGKKRLLLISYCVGLILAFSGITSPYWGKMSLRGC